MITLKKAFKIIKKNQNHKVDISENKKIIKPFFKSIPDNSLKKICGLNINQLEEISKSIHCSVNNIFEFLTIIKQDLSQSFSSILFKKSQSNISSTISNVIQSFEINFVPFNLGQKFL